MRNDFYLKKESVNKYIEMAKDVNSQKVIDAFKLHLNSNSKILELGTGPGTDWEILNKEFEIIGSDFSDELLEILKGKYPSGRFLQLDAITIETNDRFDAIYANKVLQHLSDVELIKSIDRQFEILNPKGLVCFTFWKGEKEEEYQGMYVNNQTKKSLLNFFEREFDILKLEEYKEFEEGDSLLLIAQKK